MSNVSTIQATQNGRARATPHAARQAPLSDLAFEFLAEAIIEGRIAPGAKLNEPELARSLGISRGPLREAVRRLEEQGLVRRRPRAGVRAVALSAATVIDMFVVREALEGMAARLAAERRTEEDVAALRRLVAHQADALVEPAPVRGVWSLHGAIARIAASPRITEVLESQLYRLIRHYRHAERIGEGRARRSVEEHRRIVEAIAERDGELAELLMRRHIAAARQVLQTHLASGNRGGEGPAP
jgi:DNA-binding GntR family transcriptional regulator